MYINAIFLPLGLFEILFLGLVAFFGIIFVIWLFTEMMNMMNDVNKSIRADYGPDKDESKKDKEKD
jgi:hypothetical protein